MKLYGVVYYATVYSMWTPIFRFISEHKNKCEEYISDLEKDREPYMKNTWKIVEFNTDEVLHLSSQVIW